MSRSVNIFAPDIQHSFQMLSKNHYSNWRVIESLQSVFLERQQLENAYAYSLDMLTKQIDFTEDGMLNDDVVELVQAYRSLLLQEQQQAEYLRDSIKSDLLVILRELFSKTFDYMRAIEINTTDLDKKLQTNMHQLNKRSKKYKQIIKDLQIAKSEQSKVNLEAEKQTQKVLLIQNINDYNKTIDEYFEGCAIQAATYREVEKLRRSALKDIFMKLQVFHVSRLKNIEYSVKNLTKKIDDYKSTAQPFAYKMEEDRTMLSKYNVNNYLEQLEEDSVVLNPSLAIKGVQASEELNKIWTRLKGSMNSEQTYSQILKRILSNNYKVDEILVTRVTSNKEQLLAFLEDFNNIQLSQEALNHLIPFNQSIQNLHKLLVEIIKSLYMRSRTEFALICIKAIAKKYDELPVHDTLTDQVQLYKLNILQSKCLSDQYFCLRHFTLALHQKSLNFTQQQRKEVIDELKVQCRFLLEHYVQQEIIETTVSMIGLKNQEVEEIIAEIKAKPV